MNDFGNTDWKVTESFIEYDIISNVEKRWSVKFPKLYIECAQIYHGGFPVDEAFDFEGHDEAVFDRLLSYNPKSDIYILKIYEDIIDQLVEGVFPFASDPFGDFICFDYRDQNNEEPRIVFWNHENFDGGNRIYYICDNFKEFLFKLYTPQLN